MRSSIQQRYAEVIDYSQYEKQIRKVMDDNIQSPDVEVVTEMVNIFDVDAFDEVVEKKEGTAAKADTIASRTSKTIREKMDEDPVFYKIAAKSSRKKQDVFCRIRNILSAPSNLQAKIPTDYRTDITK